MSSFDLCAIVVGVVASAVFMLIKIWEMTKTHGQLSESQKQIEGDIKRLMDASRRYGQAAQSTATLQPRSNTPDDEYEWRRYDPDRQEQAIREMLAAEARAGYPNDCTHIAAKNTDRFNGPVFDAKTSEAPLPARRLILHDEEKQ